MHTSPTSGPCTPAPCQVPPHGTTEPLRPAMRPGLAVPGAAFALLLAPVLQRDDTPNAQVVAVPLTARRVAAMVPRLLRAWARANAERVRAEVTRLSPRVLTPWRLTLGPEFALGGTGAEIRARRLAAVRHAQRERRHAQDAARAVWQTTYGAPGIDRSLSETAWEMSLDRATEAASVVLDARSDVVAVLGPFLPQPDVPGALDAALGAMGAGPAAALVTPLDPHRWGLGGVVAVEALAQPRCAVYPEGQAVCSIIGIDANRETVACRANSIDVLLRLAVRYALPQDHARLVRALLAVSPDGVLGELALAADVQLGGWAAEDFLDVMTHASPVVREAAAHLLSRLPAPANGRRVASIRTFSRARGGSGRAQAL